MLNTEPDYSKFYYRYKSQMNGKFSILPALYKENIQKMWNNTARCGGPITSSVDTEKYNGILTPSIMH